MRVLEFCDVAYCYKKKKVVENISFYLNKGEVLGLLGPNGAGKSTILSIAATLLKPSEGCVIYEENKGIEHYKEIRSKIGFVPQEIALYGNIGVKENLNFFAKLYGLKGDRLKARVEKSAEVVGISLGEIKKVKELSGGMKRRINIAVALLNEPQILIMDEPTVGIDLPSRRYILKAMKELKNQGTAILYASHYIEEVLGLCSKIVILNEGAIIGNKSIEELYKSGINTAEEFEREMMKWIFSKK